MCYRSVAVDNRTHRLFRLTLVTMRFAIFLGLLVRLLLTLLRFTLDSPTIVLCISYGCRIPSKGTSPTGSLSSRSVSAERLFFLTFLAGVLTSPVAVFVSSFFFVLSSYSFSLAFVYYPMEQTSKLTSGAASPSEAASPLPSL